MRPLALVTGGCHRLGAAIAARLAGAGWDLALHGHGHPSPEPALARALDAAGAAWSVTVADFSDPESAPALMGDVAGHWGRAPRLLVNGAAIFGQDRLETTTAAELMRHYAVNCVSPTLLTAAFAALDGGGEGGEDRSVVNILDQRLVQPHGDQLAYTLSKFALAGLTQLTARELAPAIRVNAVAPGLTVPTGDYPPALLDELAALMPLARLPEPAQVADAVVYLAAAGATTGQVLYVDAGARLKNWRRDFMHEAADRHDG